MNKTTPSLQQLRYLLALEHTGNFSKAAHLCFVTQSTLSLGIKDLEATLGQKVVERRGRQTHLTTFGQNIAAKAEQVMGHVQDIMALAHHSEDPLSGVLSLGVIPTIAPYFLPRILPTLQKDFSRLELQLYEDLSSRLIESLRTGRLDVVLMAFPYDTPGMQQFPLFEEAFMLACPCDTKIKPPNPMSLKDLESQTVLLLEDGHCLRDHALSACKIASPSQRKTFSATSLPTLIQMVQHGFGVTLLPEMACHSGSLPDGIDLISFKSPQPKRHIGLVWRKNTAKRSDYMLLGDTMKAAIKELQNAT